MRFQSLVRLSAFFALAVGVMIPVSSLAQTFSANTGTDPVVGSAPGAAGTTMKPGHHRRGDEKQLFGRVRDGVYTVDGMVAKVRLNYDVNGVDYMYLFVPGLGTAVVSATPDPDQVAVTAKLHENELSFTVGEHRFSLTGVALSGSKGGVTDHLFVRLDRSAWQLNRHPMVGFGDMAQMPYQWPGALVGTPVQNAEEEQMAPPVPASLLPSTRAVTPGPEAARPVSLRPVAMQ